MEPFLQRLSDDRVSVKGPGLSKKFTASVKRRLSRFFAVRKLRDIGGYFVIASRVL
jgi:hypothetical protein